MTGSRANYVDNMNQFFSAGLTIRQKEPKNLEAPFDRIDSYLTPTELFYIGPRQGRGRRDATRQARPEPRHLNYGTYVINHSLPIEVFIDESQASQS